MNMKNHVILNDVPIVGDFLLIDSETETVLHDSTVDGGDVPPLLCIAPVVSISVVHGLFRIDVLTHWERM